MPTRGAHYLSIFIHRVFVYVRSRFVNSYYRIRFVNIEQIHHTRCTLENGAALSFSYSCFALYFLIKAEWVKQKQHTRVNCYSSSLANSLILYREGGTAAKLKIRVSSVIVCTLADCLSAKGILNWFELLLLLIHLNSVLLFSLSHVERINTALGNYQIGEMRECVSDDGIKIESLRKNFSCSSSRLLLLDQKLLRD